MKHVNGEPWNEKDTDKAPGRNRINLFEVIVDGGTVVISMDGMFSALDIKEEAMIIIDANKEAITKTVTDLMTLLKSAAVKNELDNVEDENE